MRSLRIPGLIDLISVSDPALVRSLADNPDLDRRNEGGPLLVRMIRRRLAQTLKTPEGALPSNLPRGSGERSTMRKDLVERLKDPDLDAALNGAVEQCATFVEKGEGDPGLLAQTLFGRIFVADFAADIQTWEAAKTINQSLGTPSFRSLFSRLTGKLDQAQRVLSRAMAGDRSGVHAISVAVHNFAETLETMRTLDRSTPAEQVVAVALVVPDRVVRQGASIAETLAGRVRPGTLVILNVAEAQLRSPDPSIGFLRDAWSGCPAHAFVPHMITRIWIAAGGKS
ncbi:MAG: hypothetical protein K5905_01490 [Roseibium sp.]|uniref:hypothetical protein n=1 Tax=Roseibium sp. TaxID=1936156 RepID=UPI00262C8E95|nr:hypothetical protein [Roseibium sp.]MCV0424123.1 hypothetical protein [Roseibium sp.]